MPDEWQLIVAATEKGVCFVGSNYGELEELEVWRQRKWKESQLVSDSAKVSPYIEMLIGYLSGFTKQLELPIDVAGTPFQEAVWQALIDIPYGETWTYSEIAEKIQREKAVRAVGTAIGANPVLILIPCHRVIGKNQTLTGYRGGLAMKGALLKLEK